MKPYPADTRRRPNYAYATTLDELCDACGSYAPPFLAEARWAAIIDWLEWCWDRAPLTNSPELSLEVARIMQADDRVRLRLPSGRRMPWTTLLPRMTPETQDDIRVVASELVADWEKAGRPNLSARIVKRQHRAVLTYIRYKERKAH